MNKKSNIKQNIRKVFLEKKKREMFYQIQMKIQSCKKTKWKKLIFSQKTAKHS